MKKNGAFLTVFALEQIGVRKTFGVPGLHNAEIYAHLSNSKFLEPVLVTQELSAGFMADAVSRTTDSIGTMVIVPGAGMTHALSAIAQAFIDGIPLMIISGGIQRESGKSFHMNRLNLENILEGIVKKYYCINNQNQIPKTIYEAFDIATSGEPGPVFIEIPIEMQNAEIDSDSMIVYKKKTLDNPFQKIENQGSGMQLFSAIETPVSKLEKAVSLLANAKFPGIYLGWGAVDAFEEVKQIAELLVAPVSTTLQGVSSFPFNHPLHTGIGFGEFSSPAGQNAFKHCDCLLAVGLKFSELATSNYRMNVPENLIHIDINPNVFHKNYLAKVAIEGNAKIVLEELFKQLKNKSIQSKNKFQELASAIKNNKEIYRKSWLTKSSDEMVTPGFFFNALSHHLPEDAIMVTDDGNHSMMTLELFPVFKSRHFICPTDFNCMGYGIPAAIAAKSVNRQKTVVAIIGHNALLVTGLELITAQINNLGIIVFIFKENDPDQIPQIQTMASLKQKESASGIINIKGLADAVKIEFFLMKNDVDISGVISKALEFVKNGKSVLVEVNIDYSRKPRLAESFIRPKSSRFRITEKLKMFFKRGEE